jgi:MYXO-CTERM domain-containing protein
MGGTMRKMLAGTAVAMALSFGAVHPAFAQTTTTPDVTVEKDDDSDSGKLGLFGLAGLLGLAGLAGLKRRDREDPYANRTGTGATRA